MKSPAFQFYPGDYLRSQRVQLLTLEEEGAYIRLLCYCWVHGSIPADPEKINRLIGKGGSTTLGTTLAAMFQIGPTAGTLVHERLEQEREKQAVWAAKSAEGGRKSAEMRQKLKGGSTTAPRVVQPPHQPNGNQHPNQMATLQSSDFSLQTSSANQSISPARQIYELYPKRVGCKAALRAIGNALRTVTHDQLKARVVLFSEAVSKWPADQKQFVPNPATWFNQGRYDDDPDTWGRTSNSKARIPGPAWRDNS